MINKGRNADKYKLKNVLAEILKAEGVKDLLEPWVVDAIKWHRTNIIRYEGVNSRNKYKSPKKL